MHPRRIGQIRINVRDVGRAVAFYRDVLGMQFLFDVPQQGLAFFDCGGVRLYLAAVEPDSPETTAALYYVVDSLEETYRALRDRGVVFHDEPHTVYTTDEVEGRMAFFEDSEGNTLALMAERPIRDAGASSPTA